MNTCINTIYSLVSYLQYEIYDGLCTKNLNWTSQADMCYVSQYDKICELEIF